MAVSYFKVQGTGRKVATHIILLLWLIFAIFPIYWVVTMSFKNAATGFSLTPKFFPFIDYKPDYLAWMHMAGKVAPGESEFVAMPLFAEDIRLLRNSVIVSFGSACVSVMLGIMAGYALSRFEYRRWKNDDIAFFILSQRMFPPVALAMPFFLLFTWFRMLDKLSSIIILHSVMNLPIATWLLKEFFSDVPRELEEAAQVDGCTKWTALIRVIVPLAAPGIAVAFFFCFIFSWNEFLLALTITFKNAKTLTVGLSGLHTIRGPLYWDIAAAALLMMTPPLIVSILANKFIIRGLALGAVKK